MKDEHLQTRPGDGPVTALKFVLTLLLSLCLSACSTVQPDLARLYDFEERRTQPPPVVLIHGAFGGRLVDAQGEERWPGNLNRLLWADYRDLALTINTQTLQPEPSALRVSGITEEVAGQDFYGRIRDVLEQVGRYREQQAGVPPTGAGRHYYVFEYDWRQDNVVSARKLHRFLDQIREDWNDPELKFDIVAHSMGGLITRYFARYGSLDVLDDNDFPVSGEGSRYLRRVVLLGTPNLGSFSSLVHMVSGMKVGFKRMPPEVLMTFPSAYQLLPHPLNSWVITHSGEPLDRDIFDMEIWRRFEFGIFDPTQVHAEQRDALAPYVYKHMERGRRFVWSLTVPAQEVGIDYVLFGGDCYLTPNRMVVEEIDGQSVFRMRPQDIRNPLPSVDYEHLMLEPGDGTVTKASLLARTDTDPTVARHRYSYFPLKYSMFLCEDHTKLTGNINFQDNLMHVLLSEDRI